MYCRKCVKRLDEQSSSAAQNKSKHSPEIVRVLHCGITQSDALVASLLEHLLEQQGLQAGVQLLTCCCSRVKCVCVCAYVFVCIVSDTHPVLSIEQVSTAVTSVLLSESKLE